MRYIVKLLDNVTGVNGFDEAEEIHLVRGNASTLYFRLMTEKTDKQGDASSQRYIPQGTSIRVEVGFDNLDVQYHIRRVASASFPGDQSIWSVPLLSQDQIAFNSMKVTLTEDSRKTIFLVETDIATEETSDRRRFT